MHVLVSKEDLASEEISVDGWFDVMFEGPGVGLVFPFWRDHDVGVGSPIGARLDDQESTKVGTWKRSAPSLPHLLYAPFFREPQ